jgi:DMSO/TMAO reductase YedYZ molybdopterin-dependent catalytic subunit
MSERDRAGRTPEVQQAMDRRRFIQQAGAGVVVVALGGSLYGCRSKEAEVAFNDPAAHETRADGRPRLPTGQRALKQLRDMPAAPAEGDPKPANFRLKIHGEVRKPVELDYEALLKLPRTEQASDVHCVTGWSLLGAEWTGVKLTELAELVGVKDSARYIIFEAAHGYTANVPLDEALTPSGLVAYRHRGDPLTAANGAPVRALIPDLYFWKSAKWLTGIRFSEADEPGFWEVRGYNNHADPWKEERYA